jgi:hypothetical protein
MRFHSTLLLISMASAKAALGAVTGQWDFDSGDFLATTGAPIRALGGPTAEGISTNSVPLTGK